MASIFYEKESNVSDIVKTGEWILLKLYGKQKLNSSDELRYTLFKRKIHSKVVAIKVDPRTLSPSSSAAGYHSLRIYHQIQAWQENDLDPLIFGWLQLQKKLEPLAYEGPIAPNNILKTTICRCKKTNCKSGNFSCKVFGLRCTDICECDVNCNNVDSIIINEESFEEEDESNVDDAE